MESPNKAYKIYQAGCSMKKEGQIKNPNKYDLMGFLEINP